jgi:hypothetical protein
MNDFEPPRRQEELMNANCNHGVARAFLGALGASVEGN